MKLFLKNILPQLKMYSEGLDKKSLLIEKPWVLVNSTTSYQKLIFKRNGELIMSTDGKVDVGKWEYLASAKSILLDRNTDKVLLNHGFLDEKVLLLSVDGSEDNFFLLANENTLPDLKAVQHLEGVRDYNLDILKIKLNNGMLLEVYDGSHRNINKLRGLKVSIESEQIPDGRYLSKSESYAFDVMDNTINAVHYYRYYPLLSGGKIHIRQQYHDNILTGDSVFLDDLPAKDGIYVLENRKKLTIEDGKITKIKGRWW